MSARRRYFESALGSGLAAHVAEVESRRYWTSAPLAPHASCGVKLIRVVAGTRPLRSDAACRTRAGRRHRGLGGVIGGHQQVRDLLRRAQAAIESAPRTGRTAPSSDNSPTNRCSSRGPTVPIAPRIPSAIGRSNPAPSFRTLAGARLMVTHLLGYPKPELSSADLIRSRLSRTAVSGIPTVMKLPLVPGYMSTSTSTRYASIPYTAADRVRKGPLREAPSLLSGARTGLFAPRSEVLLN